MATYSGGSFMPGGDLGTNSYYLLVESDGPNEGQITIKSGNETIGIIPLDNSFRADPNATKEEIDYFSSAAGQKAVKNQAVLVAKKSGDPNPQQLIFPNSAEEEKGSNSEDVKPGDLTNMQIKSKDQRESYGPPEHLRYPEELDDQDTISFTMRKYVPPSGLKTNKSGDKFTGIIDKNQQTGTPLGTVVLSIQPTITDDNSVKWNEDSLNALELAALNLSQATISGGMDGARSSIENMEDIIKGKEGENIKKALLTAASGGAIGKNVLSRVSGGILNPNIELLFNGPSLRNFNYSFKLSPRKKEETRNIIKIIRFFKQGMAVQRSANNLFLTTPNIFEIKYNLRGGKEHQPYINRIKTCALTRCSVDYTPTGSYMTFSGDGGMVSYTLNLTFEELEPIYSDDYTTIDGDNKTEIKSIGY